MDDEQQTKPKDEATVKVEVVAEKGPEQAPEPKPLPKEPKKGVYVLEAGDTPGTVARKIYGRGSYAIALARANMGCAWLEGDTIDLV